MWAWTKVRRRKTKWSRNIETMWRKKIKKKIPEGRALFPSHCDTVSYKTQWIFFNMCILCNTNGAVCLVQKNLLQPRVASQPKFSLSLFLSLSKRKRKISTFVSRWRRRESSQTKPEARNRRSWPTAIGGIRNNQLERQRSRKYQHNKTLEFDWLYINKAATLARTDDGKYSKHQSEVKTGHIWSITTDLHFHKYKRNHRENS